MPFMIEAEPWMVAAMMEYPSISEEEEDSVLGTQDCLSGVSGLLRPRCFNINRKLLKGSLSDDLQVRLFSFSSLSAATRNFSAANKLGHGGFGSVYKGNLAAAAAAGEDGAIKRLSSTRGRGSDELKNELLLVSKLQHRNVIRLLGCCLEGDQVNIIVYEYLPNKSLDHFLFDSANHSTAIIDWTTRVTIIQGIAHGLCYLHHYSTLTIIHLDLNPSNILLDECMNPKISDFGLARIVAGDQEKGYTFQIYGTPEYKAPEYCMHGIFSIKSDVFSFGILLLQILSGKKEPYWAHDDTTNYCLCNHAFELWTKGKTLELNDLKLEETCVDFVLFTRYVHVGLLCIQRDLAKRPTMSQVVMMLGRQQYYLFPPQAPPFD